MYNHASKYELAQIILYTTMFYIIIYLCCENFRILEFEFVIDMNFVLSKIHGNLKF